jgi:hypothetical protein
MWERGGVQVEVQVLEILAIFFQEMAKVSGSAALYLFYLVLSSMHCTFRYCCTSTAYLYDIPDHVLILTHSVSCCS